MSLRPYEFIAAQRLCAPVADAASLDPARFTLYKALSGQTVTHRPPEFVLEGDDLTSPGQVSAARIDLRSHSVTSQDTFIATLPGAVVEMFSRRPVANNTFTVFVDDGVAVAEAFHGRASSDNIARLLGEAAPVAGLADAQPVKLYEAGPPDRVVEQPCLLMASRFVHHNYYHWIFEGLPRLWAIAALPGGDKLPLVFPTADLRPFHVDLLRGLGVSNPIVALNNRLTRFERLYFPSFLDGATVTARQIAWLRGNLFRAFPEAAKGGPRRIYVSRRDAQARRVSNEDAVMERLARHGFELVVPGKLSPADQIRVFAGAEIVIAPHGAGNTNVAFCPPGAIFLELLPDRDPSALYWMVGNVAGLRYGRMICPEDQRGVSMAVDPGRLESLLGQALAVL